MDRNRVEAVRGNVDGQIRKSKGAGAKCDLRNEQQREKKEESRERREEREERREKREESRQTPRGRQRSRNEAARGGPTLFLHRTARKSEVDRRLESLRFKGGS